MGQDCVSLAGICQICSSLSIIGNKQTMVICRVMRITQNLQNISFQKPHFSVPNLSALRYPAGKEAEYKAAVDKEIGDFQPALTDKGMCMVWNGETMSQTYKESDRVKDLTDSLDSRDSARIQKIQGTGTRFRKTMWLDLGGR